ncbi:MAG: hypothetical protein M1834_007238 [Cirrosporium novae-zelandiae]|nr:MAG: hypothetical protein M1834_007238 [Cirrosporium novae-zelandiae]
MAMVQAREARSGPPYVSTSIASVGGHPTVDQDIPICAVLIFVYLVGAIANMTIYQLNRRKGHKFFMSCAMFGFCMSRVSTCVLRLVWATRPENAHIAIAAQIFTNVGVLVIYIVVLLLALRIFRATHSKLGWNRLLGKTLTVSYVLLLIAVLLTIGFTILSYYTLNLTLKSVALWVQRGSILYIMIFNVMSLVLLLMSLLPHAPDNENFGTGSIGSKLIILGVAVFFSIFIAAFRTGTAWSVPRPASNPAWYDTKAAFYVLLFIFEIIIVYLFLFTRFDRRFWVPDGSKKSGDYSQIELDSLITNKTLKQDKM